MEIVPQTEQPCLTVSELTHLLGRVIEEAVPQVAFTGEIFQFTRARSGHLYFTVRDKDSQVSTVMWQGMTRGLDFEPETGDQVICYGKPTFYSKAGRLQIVVHRMVPVGDGQLQKRFEKLKAKLEKEGFFDDSRKREIPFLPTAIGVITSRAGAAIHDIMNRIRDRMPSQVVYLYDAKVQGDGAAEQIAAGIEKFQESGLVDVIIVGRGGGSLEDLWAFNEERVVKAIFASRIPVISAVGHEVDVTLSDMVADLRAPTPTAAGEMVVPRCDELLAMINQLEDRLFDLDEWFAPLQQRIDEAGNSLELALSRLLGEGRLIVDRLDAQVQRLRPDRLLSEMGARVEALRMRVRVAMAGLLVEKRRAIDRQEGALQAALPIDRLRRFTERLSHLQLRLGSAAFRAVEVRASRLKAVDERLRSVSPERVFERGYALVTHKGKTVRDAQQLSPGDELNVRLHVGGVEAQVRKIAKR